jgi:hypothetical protein
MYPRTPSPAFLAALAVLLITAVVAYLHLRIFGAL